jgi:hypothetical protein
MGEIETRESWRDVAARIVAALGGLVIWVPKPLKVGSVIRVVGTGPLCAEATADQPFVVIGEATDDDWRRQMSFVGCHPGIPGYGYCYFVRTD